MSAYIIARIDVTDPEDYMTYASQTVALAEKAGGRFLAKVARKPSLKAIVLIAT